MAFFIGALGISAAQTRAGAARQPVTPDLEKHAPVFLAGFGQNRRATGVHDDLWARCLALRSGQSTPLVLCGVDSIGLFHEDVERIRDRVRRQLGGPAEIVVATLHDHEAPDTMGLWGPAPGQSGLNEAYNQFVMERTAQAAVEAVRSAVPANLHLARVHSSELDSFIHDTRPPVVHDSELVILSAKDRSDRRITTLVNWANHPETLGSKNTLVTADYPAYFYTRLEERLGGVAVLINGAVGGMQSPLGAKLPQPENSFERAAHIGRRVADLAADALEHSKPVEVRAIRYRERLVSIPVTNQDYQVAAKAGVFKGRKPFNPDGATSTPVGYVRLEGPRGPLLEIALVPGELYPELSVGGIARFEGTDYPDAPFEPALKRLMKAPFRMVFGLANDEIGYIIPRSEWDEVPPWLQNSPKRWYGEVNSVGPEAAPRILNAIAELIAGK